MNKEEFVKRILDIHNSHSYQDSQIEGKSESFNEDCEKLYDDVVNADAQGSEDEERDVCPNCQMKYCECGEYD